MLDLIIKAIVESTRESRRAEEARRAWEQQRAWEEQQRLWQAQQRQWAGPQRDPETVGRVYAPPPLPRATQPVAEKPRVAAPVPAPAPRRPATTGATAPAIHQWMRPETLRGQFILTEILKPPLALRPPRE